MMNRVWLGTLLLVASATAYSSAGFFTRLIPVDAWTLLFWRGLFGGTFLAIVVVWQQRGRLWQSIRAMGWEGAVVMRGTQLERCVVGKDCRVKTDAAIFDGIIVNPQRRE